MSMARPKVVAIDDYEGVVRRCGPWKQVEGRIELDVVHEHLEGQALLEILQDAEVVVAMRERTRFGADLLDRLPRLRLLVTKGMWNAAIDLAAADRNGIVVSGTGNIGAPTAELTWALILALRKNLPAEMAGLLDGRWQQTLGGELDGATLGVIGLGHLGSRVAQVGAAFGMRVLAWSQNLRPERAEIAGVEAVPKDDLLAEADIVSLHLRLSARTRGCIGAAELRTMRPSSLLINTARAQLVDTAALIEALRIGAIAGAGLDVFDEEPLPLDHPLRTAPNVIMTPHIGFVTREAYEHHFAQVVETIDRWLEGTSTRVLNGITVEDQGAASPPAS
jgi:phosphoglycerate dehydrogenase-like enzyme